MINVFIPHRWNYNDYEVISALLDRTKYKVRDYSVPSTLVLCQDLVQVKMRFSSS